MPDKAGGQPWHVRARLKPLKGWITVEDAADILGISRIAVHGLIERGTIKRAYTLGRRPERRPTVVVSEKEILALPMSPQRKRELRLKGLLPSDDSGNAPSLSPDLGGAAPEG